MSNTLPEHRWRRCPVCGREKVIKSDTSKQCSECRYHPGWHRKADAAPALATAPAVPITSYDQAHDDLDAIIGRVASRYAGPAEREAGQWQKILIASDPHHPFFDADTVGQLFAREADADVFVLAGDALDSFAISRFIKYEVCRFEDELAAFVAFLDRASQTWPKVVLLEGNHDRTRFEKALRTRLDDHLMAIVEFLAGGNLSVLRALASRYPNVTVARVPVGRFSVDWMYQHGDCIVTHAEKFSIVPGGALRKIEDWLLDQEQNLSLAPWKVLVQAHTHGLGWFPFHANRLLVESGCLCATQGYQLTARIGGRPQRNGWVTLEQKNGVTDRDSVRCRWPERQEQAA